MAYATLAQVLGKGRALRPDLATSQPQLQSWLKDLEAYINRSPSLSKSIDVGIYFSQFKNFPTDAIRLDRLIAAIEAEG